jgi:FdrA protein
MSERLLDRQPHVVNVGLTMFAETLDALGVPVVHVDWRPPGGGDARIAALLARLDDGAGGEDS